MLSRGCTCAGLSTHCMRLVTHLHNGLPGGLSLLSGCALDAGICPLLGSARLCSLDLSAQLPGMSLLGLPSRLCLKRTPPSSRLSVLSSLIVIRHTQ